MSFIEIISTLVLKENANIKFTMLEVGALSINAEKEPFYQLLDLFEGSTIISFEVDKSVCDSMNKVAKKGVRYYPVALGEQNELHDFYVTQHPMCCSLYPPNEILISKYHNFEVAYLKHKTQIETVSLDSFQSEYHIGAVDFIKIDIQGAELDVFKGANQALRDVLAIVCEVEFIPHYVGQPLFGDVCSFLDTKKLMFHKFLGLCGRSLKPVIFNNDLNYASQHIWSDAYYTRNILLLDGLTDIQLLKSSVLACIYQSPDLSYFYLNAYDKRNNKSLASQLISAVKS